MMRARGLFVSLVISAVAVGCPSPRTATSTRDRTEAKGQPDRSPIASAAPIDAGDADSGDAQLSAISAQLSAISAWDERRRRDPTDLCEPVRENLDRAARTILSADRTKESAVPKKAWDHATPPKFMDLLDRRFLLTAGEKALLKRNGFVVSARLEARSYAHELHELYQSQVPIFVSADAILHSVFKSNDAILEQTETSLAPKLEAALEKMHGALSTAKTDYPAEIASDVDVYLTVARSLLAETDVKSTLGTDAQAAPLIASTRKATGGLGSSTLFGRPRVIDFSQFAPRGHYAKTEELQRYFRASMWLSRLEMNLVSRASRSSQPGLTPNPEETPREAVVALAIADLAERAKVLADLDVMEAAWTHFAGKREDVSLRSLLALRQQAGITTLSVPGSAEKLRTAIGTGYPRTTRVHYMPQGSMPLPVIATMLGPRIVADAQAETELVHAQVVSRSMPSFADVSFMMGHERARTWLAKDLAAFPQLAGKLEKGRGILASAAPTDMYSAWLGAIRALAVSSPGEAPSYEKTDAFRDMRVNSTVAAYGQIRHNYVLIAGQAYDEGGCEVPDGYIEPAVPVYEALLTYARRGGEAMKALGGSAANVAYFGRLESTLRVLIAISKDELAGRALSEEEKRWLSMVVEIVPPSSDGPGSYDGWYFDLFPSIQQAFDEHAFVADWFTSSNANAVVYAGATNPRLGFFVVDTGGEPRLMVGPVARAFEHVGSLDKRLKDSDVDKLRDLREPWAASYTVAAPPTPPLLVFSVSGPEGGRTFAVKSTRALGPVTLELLGHHREKLGSVTAQIGTGFTRMTIKQTSQDYGEVVRVRIGEVSRELSSGFGDINEGIGGMQHIPYETAYELREKLDARKR